ncbi:hypothetical protein PG2006B_1117 [Bifidobacterium animalis subsp. animalis]|uniref:hypothetical protein n=1 Tax=Bifidobacterium animalis TaxID=28025 RepID=UPI00101F5879|nr:hypothetical protein [Bifidobacterium animalis]RYN12651.1 hypothetical protein PG2006B_1117 [Bifidobacterium animalis subsp. animalis]
MRETYIDEDGYTYETRPYGARRYVDSPELEDARNDLKAARTRHDQLGAAYDEERNPVLRDQLRMDYLLACTDVTRAEIAVEIAERHLREREDDYGYIAVDGTRVPYGSGKPAFHLDQDGNAVGDHDDQGEPDDGEADAGKDHTACQDDDGGADEVEWILISLPDYVANVDEAVTCTLRDVNTELERNLSESYDRVPANATDTYRTGFNVARTVVVSTMARLLDRNRKAGR